MKWSVAFDAVDGVALEPVLIKKRVDDLIWCIVSIATEDGRELPSLPGLQVTLLESSEDTGS